MWMFMVKMFFIDKKYVTIQIFFLQMEVLAILEKVWQGARPYFPISSLFCNKALLPLIKHTDGYCPYM